MKNASEFELFATTSQVMLFLQENKHVSKQRMIKICDKNMFAQRSLCQKKLFKIPKGKPRAKTYMELRKLKQVPSTRGVNKLQINFT